MELLIQNCTIIDGTGAPAYRGSVGFDAGKLRVFRGDAHPDAAEFIDATGLTLTPGFIDAHSHGDLTLMSPYAMRSKLSQGFTTQIAGQCGVSMFPAAPAQQDSFPRFVSGIAPYPDVPKDFSCLESAGSFLSWVDSLQSPLHTKCFVGHGTLRLWAMGYENRKPDETELARMCSMLHRCIREGALGLSTGLVYAPSCYADNDEILALLRVVHEEGGYYATHPRNEADHVEEARAESIRLAKEAGVPLCVSHLKAAGRKNWGKPRALLEQVERAADDGLRIIIDCYPYMAGNTSLNVSIPPRYFEDGLAGLVEALRSPIERERIKEEMSRPSNYDNYVLNSGGFSGVCVAGCPVMHDAEGQFIPDYAARVGKDPFDAFCDILIQNGGLGLAMYFHMNEHDVVDILSHPLCTVGSDGLVGLESESPHPRSFGTTARAYDLLVRKHARVSPEEMIHKLSGQIAAFLGIDGKGRIQDGYDADVLLLDLERFIDRSTYQNGSLPCEGIRAIYCNGKRVRI